jgi:hypothetical protein
MWPASAIENQSLSNSFLGYSNSEFGVKMEYPADWEKQEGGPLDRLSCENSTVSSPLVVFFSPDKSVDVTIVTDKVTGNKTLESHVNDSVSSTLKSQPNMKNIESTKTTLGGLPAYKIVFKGTFDVGKVLEKCGLDVLLGSLMEFKPVTSTAMMFFTIKDDRSYLLAYGDETEALSQLTTTVGPLGPLGETPPSTVQNPFSYFLPTFQRMADSFKFTEGTMTSVVLNDSSSENGSSLSNDIQSNDPLQIIKMRLAEGEITIQQYEELKKTLENNSK